VDVDGCLEHQAQLRPAAQHAWTERPPQLGEQRAQGGVGRRGRALGPQQVDQLAARAAALAVEDQVRRDETALPPRDAALQATTLRLDDHRPAEPDVPALTHRSARQYSATNVSPRFRQLAGAMIRLAVTRNGPTVNRGDREV